MSKNNKKYSRDGITPEKIMAYIETKAGKSQRQVARETGRNHATISRWTGEIEEYIKSSPEYREAGPVITGMIPKAFSVYEARLAKNDLAAARDVLKMAVIYVEKKQYESADFNRDDFDLYAELRGLIASDVDDIIDPQLDTAGASADSQDSAGIETPED